MKPLVISEQTAIKMYPSASSEIKTMLEESFGKAFFSKDITERINSFEDACTINGTDPSDHRFTQGSCDTNAYEMLKEIAEAYREGVQLSYKNGNQEKWFPIHQCSSSGFRFDDSIYDGTYTDTPVGLCVDTKKKADDFGRKFIHLFEQYKI